MHNAFIPLPTAVVHCSTINFFFYEGSLTHSFFSFLKAIAYATTPKGCKFRVQLFKRDGSVLVEVQRRSGCCVKFHSLAMQILFAAKGCECPHHYAIDDHKQLKVPVGCDLPSSVHANLRQGTTAY